MEQQPLVTCIMPTRNRRAFIPRAIAYFQRQEYPHRELLILDDGSDPIADLVPADPTIRYIRLEQQLTVGAKRNLACQEALGELIAHWDDDDWMAAWRLSYQVTALLRSDASMCGINHLLFYRPETDQAWEYAYSRGARAWLAGGSFLYKRALWQAQPFQPINNGEDTRFVWAMPSGKVLALPDTSFYIALIHPANTAPKQVNNSRWRTFPVDTLRTIAAADWPLVDGIAPPAKRSSPIRSPVIAPKPVRQPGLTAVKPVEKRPLLASADSAANVRTRLARLQADPLLPWDGWGISRSLAQALLDHLLESRPGRVLELGSGVSSVVLGLYADICAATAPGTRPVEIISLEHDQHFFLNTKRLLRRHNLLRHIDLRLAPLEYHTLGGQPRLACYATRLVGTFDFIFVDGPPRGAGRLGALWALQPYLASGWELWLKDGHRAHEQDCVRRWAESVAFDSHLADFDPRGVWVLNAPQDRANTSAATPIGEPQAVSAEAACQTEVQNPEEPAIFCLSRAQSEPGSSSDSPDTSFALPLVSCIMPTYNRPGFISQALRYFSRQDYPNREVVVIDDGSQPVADLLPDDPAVHYIRTAVKKTIGAKRNLACEAARGEIIICWDDDDWYGPARITRQVTPLLAGQADFSGLTDPLFFDLSSRRFWSCSERLQVRLFSAGVISGTLAFYKYLWEHSPFPAVQIAEDAMFQRMLQEKGARLGKIPGQGLFIYVRHNANSWRITTGRSYDQREWKRETTPAFLSPEDRTFYGLPV